MLREMELRHLRYFVAVAEALSFTKAAEKLRIAQPSLTKQVRNLEDEIGVKLLDRSNNCVALTDAGSLFLFESKKLLAICAESIAAAQRMNRGESRGASNRKASLSSSGVSEKTRSMSGIAKCRVAMPLACRRMARRVSNERRLNRWRASDRCTMSQHSA